MRRRAANSISAQFATTFAKWALDVSIKPCRDILKKKKLFMFMFKDITPHVRIWLKIFCEVLKYQVRLQVPYQSIDATTGPRQIWVWVSDGYCQRASYYSTEIGQNWYACLSGETKTFVETGSRGKFIYTHEGFEKSEEVGMKPEIDEKNPPPPMNHL